jgi:hypothetical protein
VCVVGRVVCVVCRARVCMCWVGVRRVCACVSCVCVCRVCVRAVGVFGRSIDAVARFLPGRPAISPLVQLPGDPSQPSPRQSLQHSGEEQPDEEDEEVRVPTTTASLVPPKSWSGTAFLFLFLFLFFTTTKNRLTDGAWTEMSMQEMAEAINARLEMETEDIDFFGSESTYDDDEEIADVRSTRTYPSPPHPQHRHPCLAPRCDHVAAPAHVWPAAALGGQDQARWRAGARARGVSTDTAACPHRKVAIGKPR